MKTVGEMLQEARQSKHLTLEDIEQGTKIRLKFLRAIESNDFGTMPSLSYAKGFVKNYGEYLGMDSRVVLAFFRRQIADAPKSSLLPKGMEQPLNRSLIQLTPGRFIGLIVVVCVVLFLAYFVLQYRTLNQPPPLIVDQPTNQRVVTDSRVDIFGRTDPDATVTINGISVLVRGDGKFFDQVGLDSGVNNIVITATSRFGKSSTVTREVGYTTGENH